MSQVVDNDQRVALIQRARQTVDVVDLHGNLIGHITPVIDDAELAKWQKRLDIDEPTFTTAQVLERLRSRQ